MKRRVRVVELGCPGHFIASRHCHWRRHTQIGTKYRVSTVGDYYPPIFDRNEVRRETLGADDDSWFETMVFETTRFPADGDASEACGCRAVKSFTEIDSRRYATAGEAQRGHEAFVSKYKSLADARVVKKAGRVAHDPNRPLPRRDR